jgi:predicted PurR-regulated permease PerM
MEKLHLGTLDEIQTKLSNIALQASKLAATKAVGLGQNTLGFVVGFGVMLYLIFFLLRDGKELVARIWAATPLARAQARAGHQVHHRHPGHGQGQSGRRCGSGCAGGPDFLDSGHSGRCALGRGDGFSVLAARSGGGPGLGAGAIYFLATGAITKGLILAAYGVLVIGLVDNALRPLLVGKDTKMPDYVVLISTLGGMALFGLSGFVLGPAIAALFMAAWELFTTMQEQEETLLNREIAQNAQQPIRSSLQRPRPHRRALLPKHGKATQIRNFLLNSAC